MLSLKEMPVAVQTVFITVSAALTRAALPVLLPVAQISREPVAGLGVQK